MPKILEFLKNLKPVKFIAEKLSEKKDKSSAKPSTPEIYVYVTLRGSKFHYDRECPSLRNTKSYRMELSKAKKAGRTACDKCCYSYLHD